MHVCEASQVCDRIKSGRQRFQGKMMQTEDLIVRYDGPAKLDIEIKSDWLLICFTFVTKSSGTLSLNISSAENIKAAIHYFW